MNKQFKIWISTIILLGFSLDNTLSAWLRCYKTSLSDYTVASLDNPTPLLNDPCFNPNLRTVIYTFGYSGKCDGPATTAVLQAYVNMKKRNVFLLDWQYEAQTGILGIPLGYALYAVPNAKKVGYKLGEALMTLTRNGLNMTEVHLIGHSLGAHVMGYAGRWTRQRGRVVSRITGLDPARALFEGALSIRSGLDRTCAQFVDIIHTNPGNYGSRKSIGTVDMWPNFSPSDGMQPGCPKGNFEMFSPEDLCSHNRAWRYLVESLSSPTAFPAAGAESYSAWLDMDKVPNVTTYMGDLTNTKARGNYYLTTNGEAPFSKGLIGMMPNNQLRKRRNPSKLALTAIFRFLRTPLVSIGTTSGVTV